MTSYFEHKQDIQRLYDEFKRDHRVEEIRGANGQLVEVRWVKKEAKA